MAFVIIESRIAGGELSLIGTDQGNICLVAQQFLDDERLVPDASMRVDFRKQVAEHDAVFIIPVAPETTVVRNEDLLDPSPDRTIEIESDIVVPHLTRIDDSVWCTGYGPKSRTWVVWKTHMTNHMRSSVR